MMRALPVRRAPARLETRLTRRVRADGRRPEGRRRRARWYRPPGRLCRGRRNGSRRRRGDGRDCRRGHGSATAPGTVASRPVRVSKRVPRRGPTAADSAQPAASDAGTPQPVASSPQATPSTAAPVAAAVTAADPGPIQSAILAAQAYIYGYPLMEYQRVRQTVETVNALYSLTSFADPDVDPIWLAIGGGKRPNVDTFYSLAELDLSNGPVVLSIPDMGDRYFSFQLTDPYTNVSGYIGSRTTGSGPGDYAITWTGGPQVDIPGAQTIPVPYASMLALRRTLAGDEADQQAAIALIKRYAGPRRGAPSAR